MSSHWDISNWKVENNIVYAKTAIPRMSGLHWQQQGELMKGETLEKFIEDKRKWMLLTIRSYRADRLEGQVYLDWE